jgi:hypothetical protein
MYESGVAYGAIMFVQRLSRNPSTDSEEVRNGTEQIGSSGRASGLHRSNIDPDTNYTD